MRSGLMKSHPTGGTHDPPVPGELRGEPVAGPESARAGVKPGFLIGEQVEDCVGELLDITGVEAFRAAAVFTGHPRPGAEHRFDEIEAAVRRRGFEMMLTERGAGTAAVTVWAPAVDAAPRSRPALALALLAATLATTTWAGALHQGIDLLREPGRWRAGLPYALALVAILGVHELGHYLTARRRGVAVTLPYFIPAPFYLGTFGAFIRMQGRVRSRADYFDVAVAGPLAGLVVAVAALVYGIHFGAVEAGHGLDPRSSTLVYLVVRAVGGEPGATRIALGAVGFAGWLGLVVTALNLVPVGQLDGGHIAYGLLGRRAAGSLASVVLGVLVALGIFASPHWLMWALVTWIVAGSGHPPALNELARIGRGRRALGVLVAALLLAIVLPWPG